MKKRFLTLCLMMVLVLNLTSCIMTSHAGDQFGEIIGERFDHITNPTDPNAPPPEPVELVSYDNGDFSPTLGFDLVSYPSHEGLMAQAFYAMDGWFGQVEYDATEGLAPVLRVAFADAEDLHTTYPHLSAETGLIREIDGLDVRVRHMNETTVMAYWVRGEFQYLLHLNRPDEELIDPVIEEMVLMVDSRAG